jgi:predicted esterase
MGPALLLAAFGLARAGEITAWLATDPCPAKGGHPTCGLPDEAHLGPDRADVRWSPLLADGPVVDLGKGTDVARFLYAEIVLAAPLRGWLTTGSDDGLAVWVDGEPRLTADRPRSLLTDEDWVPLDLAAGRHRLLVAVGQGNGAWSLQARLRDRHYRPADARVELPGVPPQAPPARAEWSLEPTADGIAVTLRVAQEAGAALDPLPARTPTGDVHEVLGVGRHDLVAHFGDQTFERTVDVDPEALRRLAALPPAGDDPTRAWLNERARRAVLDHADDRAAWLDRAASPDLVRGVPLERAYRGPYDGRPWPYALYVPDGDPPPAGWPTLVALHGLGNDPSEIVQHLRAHPSTAGVAIVAPTGYGDVVFRGPGEHDVFAALEELRRVTRVDPDRTWLTGVSMGGMGTFELGVRHPDTFAALGALCGAGDWRGFGSIHGRRLAPWEDALIEARSPAELAANSPPLFCVHGTRDRINPVSSSEAMVAVYERLGLPVRFEKPPLGHDVGALAYDQGLLMPALTPFVRDPRPAHVALLVPTTTLVPSRRGWLEALGVARVGPVAHLEGTASPGKVVVSAPEISALRLHLDEAPVGDGPVAAQIDGQAIPGLRGVVDLRRDGAKWIVGGPDESAFPPPRRPGLSGPADAVLAAPVRVVYGTADPDTADGLRMLAEHLAAIRPGSQLAVPVIADTALTDRGATNLILVGSPRENRVLAGVADRLPFRVEPGAVHVGARAFRGPTLGLELVYPDPAAPGHLLLVVAGTDLQGTLLARHLPDLVPDWLVYDPAVQAQRAGPVLDRRRVRGGGFFGPRWEAPESARLDGRSTARPGR